MTLNIWRHSTLLSRRRRVFMYAVVLGAFCASCSEAWVVVPPRGCDRSGRRRCQQPSPHRDARSRKRPPPHLPSSRERAPPTVPQSAADGQAEGPTPPPLPFGKSSDVGAEAVGSKPLGGSVSWQEQFATLRNDAADPWTRADDGGSSSSSSERSTESAPPAASSLGISVSELDGSSSGQEQAATGGGAAAKEELAGAESPLTATATAAATAAPEETGRSRHPAGLIMKLKKETSPHKRRRSLLGEL